MQTQPNTEWLPEVTPITLSEADLDRVFVHENRVRVRLEVPDAAYLQIGSVLAQRGTNVIELYRGEADTARAMLVADDAERQRWHESVLLAEDLIEDDAAEQAISKDHELAARLEPMTLEERRAFMRANAAHAGVIAARKAARDTTWRSAQGTFHERWGRGPKPISKWEELAELPPRDNLPEIQRMKAAQAASGPIAEAIAAALAPVLEQVRQLALAVNAKGK